jgi:amidase
MLLFSMTEASAAPERAHPGLRGIRLGMVRDYAGAGGSPDVEAAISRWLGLLRAEGAEVVDPSEIGLPAQFNHAELEVLLHEFKAGIDEYLAAEHVQPSSLAGLITFDREHASKVMPYFGQELFLAAMDSGGLDDPEYRQAVAESQGWLRTRLASLFAGEQLDALVAPVNPPAPKVDLEHGDRIPLSSSSIAAVSGYPSVAVPGGLVDGLPVGLAFVGKPYTEAALIEIAAAFERLRGPLPPPTFLPTLE